MNHKSDYLKFDGGNATVAEILAGDEWIYIHLPSVTAISTRTKSMDECTEEVSILIGHNEKHIIMNCDVYDNLIDAWLYVQGNNRPRGKRIAGGWE